MRLSHKQPRISKQKIHPLFKYRQALTAEGINSLIFDSLFDGLASLERRLRRRTDQERVIASILKRAVERGAK